MIPIYNFRKVKETNDLRYLLKLKDYEYLPNINTSYLKPVWENIQFQEVDEIKKSAKWVQLEDEERRNIDLSFFRYKRVICILNYLSLRPDNAEVWENELNNIGYRLNTKKPYDEALKHIAMVAKNHYSESEIRLEGLKKQSQESENSIHTTLENVINYTKLGINEFKDTYCMLIHRMARINEDIQRQKMQANG